MQKPSSSGRHAFTMLELIAVIVMLGLISAIGFMAISGPLDQSQLTRMSQAIADADRKEREFSRQSPLPGGLTIEKSKGLLFYRASDRQINLGSRLKITDVIVNSPTGDEAISFSQSGQSPTYAVRLESRRGASIWVVFVGISGQVIFDSSAINVRTLLAMGGPT